MEKKKPDPWNRLCPSRAVLGILGDKWTLLIFPLLKGSPRRNAELLRLTDGISQKVLTETLRRLEAHGLVSRHDYKTVPPKVDYRLTDLGRTLARVMGSLDQWVVEHYYEMANAKINFERKARRKPNRKPLSLPAYPR